jgi:comEA protein
VPLAGVPLALCADGADTQSKKQRPDLTAQTGVVPRLHFSLEDSMRRILFALVILLATAVAAPSVVTAAQAAKPSTSSKGSGTAKVAGTAKSKATAASPVNLNSASVAQLQTLPGIGASAAQRIVEYRQKNGTFKKIEELMNVKGIGEKSFLKLKPLVTVGADKGEHASGDK